MIPFSLTAIIAGYLFILKALPKERRNDAGSGKLSYRALAATITPIMTLVACSVGGSGLLPRIGVDQSIANLVAMLLGLATALCVVFYRKTSSVLPALSMLRSKKTWSLILVILGVQSFSAALKMPLGDSVTLVSLMRDELFSIGAPIIFIIMFLPFVSGLVTGVAVGFVGASFPLVFALLGENPPLGNVIATTALAYAFGYAGMIISPIHICFVVTSEYFKTQLFRAYPYLAGPIVSIMITSAALSALYWIVLS